MSDQRRKDFVASAKAAWGSKCPEWVIALAEDATLRSLGGTSKRLSYSASTISYVLANNYKGDLRRVEKVVRGALMSEQVICPVVGEIPLDRCLFEQGRSDIGGSAIRTRLYHKCRGIGTERCPHSLLGREGK
jgi:hypothetical protein